MHGGGHGSAGEGRGARRRRIVLRPARVFDGDADPRGLGGAGERHGIEAAGPAAAVTAPGATVLDLPGTTLMPGLIEGHSHVLLHPYNETTWNDQVLKESTRAARRARDEPPPRPARAGFTTIRDLGTEGAGYADVELKQAVDQGIIPGPRMLVTTSAIVATGSYAPKGFALGWRVPQGAEEADGDSLVRVVRDQIGHGADWIKIYADYRWGPDGSAQPTFSDEELTLIVETARSSGRPVVAHATHRRRDAPRGRTAGVETIEHGDDGTPEVFRLMARAASRSARRSPRATRSPATAGRGAAVPNRRRWPASARPSRPRSTPASRS